MRESLGTDVNFMVFGLFKNVLISVNSKLRLIYKPHCCKEMLIYVMRNVQNPRLCICKKPVSRLSADCWPTFGGGELFFTITHECAP